MNEEFSRVGSGWVDSIMVGYHPGYLWHCICRGAKVCEIQGQIETRSLRIELDGTERRCHAFTRLLSDCSKGECILNLLDFREGYRYDREDVHTLQLCRLKELNLVLSVRILLTAK